MGPPPQIDKSQSLKPTHTTLVFTMNTIEYPNEHQPQIDAKKLPKEQGLGATLLPKEQGLSAKLFISDEDRNVNYLFVGDDLFLKEKKAAFGDEPYWKTLLNRVASFKKPLATVNLKGKLEHSWSKVLEPLAASLNVRIIGPYPDLMTGAPTLTLIHEDLISRGAVLRDLALPQELAFFGHDQDPILSTPLEAYIHGAEISRGNNHLECALVFGYPLDRAKEIL
jgi:hypothetical protein